MCIYTPMSIDVYMCVCVCACVSDILSGDFYMHLCVYDDQLVFHIINSSCEHTDDD